MSLKYGRFVIAAFLVTSCLRLDVFVFRPKAAEDLNADLMATSKVPANLRQELKDEIVADDGTKVSAYLLKHEIGDGSDSPSRHKRGLLYCHGNNTHIGTTVPRLDALWKLGYTVLAFDARGWGKTTGDQTEKGVAMDAAAALKYLENRADLGLSADKVGLYGRSLGSAICTKLAVARSAKALALESPISSIQVIIDDSLVLDTPSSWYADTRMDNFAQIPNYSGALLIMHGQEDDYVQPRYGQELHDLATGHANPNVLWMVPGADHGTVPCTKFGEPPEDNGCEGGFNPEYERQVMDFFDAALTE